MKKVLLAAGALGVALIIATAGSDSTPATATSRPGNPTVYAEIAAQTDCTELQASFDRGEATHERGGSWGPLGTSYMEAADTRMRAIGCY